MLEGLTISAVVLLVVIADRLGRIHHELKTAREEREYARQTGQRYSTDPA